MFEYSRSAVSAGENFPGMHNAFCLVTRVFLNMQPQQGMQCTLVMMVNRKVPNQNNKDVLFLEWQWGNDLALPRGSADTHICT